MSFFEELKRRNVVRVGIAYLFGSWLLAQIAELILDTFNAPDWTMQFILVLLAIGFPLALFFAWAFELTPDGIKKEAEVDRSQPSATSGRKLNHAILVLAVLAAGYFFWESRIKTAEHAPAQAAVGVEELAAAGDESSGESNSESADITIAVMPFVNMSSDAEQEYFSDGITEEILNVLAKIDGMRVTSRSSAFSLKGQNLDIPSIAERLGVEHVLEGSVRKAGNQVRITAQLIRSSDDSHLWSETYDRELENIFAIQDEISRAIANALQVQLGAELEAYQPPTQNLQAYELFLRGRELQRTRNIDNLVNSMSLFQQALDLDPGFADASGNLALSAMLLASRRQQEDVGIGPEHAERFARQTLELNPENALALIVLSQMANDRWDWQGAADLLEQARISNESEATVTYWRALFWLQTGFAAKALELLESAERKDPLNANIWRWLSNAHGALGSHIKAAEYMDRAVRVNQGFSGAVVEHLLTAGERERAEAYFAEHIAGDDDSDARYELFFNNDHTNMIAAVDAKDYERVGYIYWRTGQYESFLAQLNLLLESGLTNRVQIQISNQFWSPGNAPMRQLPQFKELVNKTGLYDFWRDSGFPPLCRPLGGEDFECD